jgi:hypothetical protein
VIENDIFRSPWYIEHMLGTGDTRKHNLTAIRGGLQSRYGGNIVRPCDSRPQIKYQRGQNLFLAVSGLGDEMVC